MCFTKKSDAQTHARRHWLSPLADRRTHVEEYQKIS